MKYADIGTLFQMKERTQDMFRFRSKKAKQEMKALFGEIQMNLENNYKDLAIDARKKAEQRLEELKSTDELNDREYMKFKKVLEGYTQRMVGYHH